ncbi:class I SAM-dependent methyltransferase [Halobacteria archaeon AArc-m2/3/4]|uniref:Class I SAM-dependent methyltransferase n=1 Tax=Natronoglomus mannanivorans TaxID=2979990 RepID=A0AAP2YX01_9EURY|nr:class I SAM-dependent methyltransferase [Halobacteria archaeon AArc-xg1-1]MCU4971406.1 class I SAM-dependent methyltransferase [Halobacteria archaeon AArc-m2/3/4]
MNSTEVLEQWADRSGAYSPDYYAYYGPNETSELIRERLESALEPDASVLELGCSSGRHLAHLHDHGYENLAGIEINDEAFEVMEDAYPELAASGQFYCDAIENVVTEFETGAFDAVFSVETLQHIHADNEWVFEELARITGEFLVTVENEGGADDHDHDHGHDEDVDGAVNYVDGDFPLYYRNWSDVFTEYGFVEVGSRSLKRDTFRVFRQPS